DQNAFGARLADQLDNTIEHACLLVMLRELAVPSAVRRDEIGLEVDQQDCRLFRLDALCGRRHRLRLRLRNKSQQRDHRCRDLEEMSHGDPPEGMKSLARAAGPRPATNSVRGMP